MKQSGSYFNWLLLPAGALLMALAWLPAPLSFLALAGFVPLLRMLDSGHSLLMKFAGSWLFCYVWHLGVMFTSVYIPMPLADKLVLEIGFYGCYALLMTLPLLACMLTLRFTRHPAGYLLLPVYWSLYEFLLNRSELGMPVLSLCNSMAAFPSQLAWMSVGGETFYVFFIWYANILLYLFWISQDKAKKKKWLTASVLLLVVFMAGNLALFFLNDNAHAQQARVAVVQPDFANKDHLDMETAGKRLQELKVRSIEAAQQRVQLLVWHESAIQGYIINSDSLAQDRVIQYVQGVAREAGCPLLTGVVLYKLYASQQQASLTARPTGDGSGTYYDVSNCAILVPPDSSAIQVYYKNKLVPFIERMPYVDKLPFTEALKIRIGSQYPSFAAHHNEQPLTYGSLKIAPMICSEAVFPAYASQLCRAGANLIVVLSNEGWTGKAVTSDIYAQLLAPLGPAQHRSTVLCSNMGESQVRDVNGRITARTRYHEKKVLIADVVLTDEVTLYAKAGEWILTGFVVVGLLVMVLLRVSSY